MAETAAVLVDRVMPRVPVRQWVLSFPIPLRILLAAHPELLLIRFWAKWPRISNWSLSSTFTQYRRAVGVPDEVDFHSARRTAINNLERRGAHSLWMVRYVGHQPLGATFSAYSRQTSGAMLLRVARHLRYADTVDRALQALVTEMHTVKPPDSFIRRSLPLRRTHYVDIVR